MRRQGICAAGLVMLWTTLAAAAADSGGVSPNLEQGIATLAKKIKLLVDSRSEKSVALGDFTGPIGKRTAHGPGICHQLRSALEQLKVTVDDDAKLHISGKYRPWRLKERPCLQLTVEITDSAEQSVGSFDGYISEPAVLAGATGVSVEGKPNKPLVEQQRVVEAAIFKPLPPHIAGDAVAVNAASPFAVAILVPPTPGSEPLPRKPAIEANRYAYVPLTATEAFQVQLINNSDREVAVELSIDGLNVFSFSEMSGCKQVLVPARDSIVVPGWHRSLTKVDDFLVAEYSTAGKNLASNASVGIITAIFRASWGKNQPPPPDEFIARLKPLGSGGLETVRGITRQVQSEMAERVVGAMRACVSIRYSK